MGLRDTFQDQTIRRNIVDDCTKLIDEQVAAKGGISGIALKAAYGVIKGVGPRYIPGAIMRILPDALEALDPMWNEGLETGNPAEYLTQNRSRTADTILSVTDIRIENASNSAVRSTYNKLRKSVKSDVEEAVPGLAKILETHTLN